MALGKRGVLVGMEEVVGGAVPLVTPEGTGESVPGWESVGTCVTVGAWGVKVPPLAPEGDTEGVARMVLAGERVPPPLIAEDAVGKGAEMVEV